MKILLDDKETLKFIHNALCNGGLSELAGCDVQMELGEGVYAQAKKELQEQIEAGNFENVYVGIVDQEPSICREDVWAQILRSGKPLTFNDCGDIVEFSLEKAKENLSKEEASDVILTYSEEQDDAYTAFELLQLCLYGEVIYG